jgi:hypothetical protein
LASLVVDLRSHPKEQKYFFEWKGFMVKKNRRNNFFIFEKEDKTQGDIGGLGSEKIHSFPSNGARNVVGIS